MMNNLRIGTRLAVGFSLLVILLLALAGFDLREMNALHTRMATIVQNGRHTAADVQQIYAGPISSAGVFLQALLRGHFTAQDHAHLLSNHHKTNKAVKNLLSIDHSTATRDYIAQIHSALGHIRPLQKQVIALMHQGNLKAARTEYLDRVLPLVHPEGNVVLQLRQSEDNEVGEAARRSEKQYQWARDLSLSLSGLAVVLALFGAIWTTRSITFPLGSVVQQMADIAEGEGDLTCRMPVAGRNELSELAQAFNRFVSRIQQLVQEVTSSTHKLVAATRELAASSQETLDSMGVQQAETEQIATAVNEVSTTVRDVAKNASNAAEAAESADSATKTGRQVVEDAAGSIGELATDIENAAQTIHELEKSTTQIGSVLDVISGISEQTNLLALNAAIEAARAGEHGRGFAVVADEVRTLAQRTQESTQEIQAMIDSLQHGSRSAVQAMNDSCTKAQVSVKQAQDADHSLHAISEAVARINDMNTQIASAAEEQAAVTDEIDRNIANIKVSTDRTSAASSQASTASDSLAQLAEHLEGLVRQFRV